MKTANRQFHERQPLTRSKPLGGALLHPAGRLQRRAGDRTELRNKDSVEPQLGACERAATRLAPRARSAMEILYGPRRGGR